MTASRLCGKRASWLFGRATFTGLIAMMVVASASIPTALPALAVDPDPCGADLVCASNPESVSKVMQDAGFQVQLTKSATDGDPIIASSVAGQDAYVEFEGCDEAHERCELLSFVSMVTSVKNPTTALVNDLNVKMPFFSSFVLGRGAIAEVKTDTIVLVWHVTTVGGLNQKNFKSVLSTWTSLLGEARKFLEERKH